MALPSQCRVIVSLVTLVTFLLCSLGNLFCPMVYAYEETVPHHSTPQSDPLKNNGGCPELVVDSMAPSGDVNSDSHAYVGLQRISHHERTFNLASLLPNGSLISSHPLLFLLLLTLRN